jgi:hypothetical protein
LVRPLVGTEKETTIGEDDKQHFQLLEGYYITHVFPYLKRPQWTICINGRMTAAGELAYPVLDKTPVMNFCSLFHNVLQGGCQLLKTQTDYKKKALELQTIIHPRHEMKLHLATFLVSNEVFTPTIQALLAHAGPTMSLENGWCLPTLPPVANCTKGPSLEGPNVGIPLVVHGQAPRVQQLAASCVLWGFAVECRLMEPQSSHQHQQRIICRMLIQRGTTHSEVDPEDMLPMAQERPVHLAT